MILYINKTSRCESWKTTVKTRHIETDSSVFLHAGGWFSANYLGMLNAMTAFDVDPYNEELEIHESISSMLLISKFWPFLFIGLWQSFRHSYMCIPLACAKCQAAGAALQSMPELDVLFGLLMCGPKMSFFIENFIVWAFLKVEHPIGALDWSTQLLHTAMVKDYTKEYVQLCTHTYSGCKGWVLIHLVLTMYRW
jgi:hypothetical protein